MKMAVRKFFRIMTEGLPNPGFMQEKVQKRGFSKKALTDFFFLFFVLGSNESLVGLEH